LFVDEFFDDAVNFEMTSSEHLQKCVSKHHPATGGDDSGDGDMVTPALLVLRPFYFLLAPQNLFLMSVCQPVLGM
jgi:hypothetical protein